MNIKEFLFDKGLSELTVEKYNRRIERFINKFGDPRSMTPKQVQAHVNGVSKSASDHNQWVSSIRYLEKYFTFREDTEYNFANLLRLKRNKLRLPKPLTQKEIDQITEQIPLNSIEGVRDRAIIELLYCGLRNAECCGILIKNLQRRAILIRGKGNKERIVPINDVAWEFLTKYLVSIQETSLEEEREKYGEDFVIERIKELYKDAPEKLVFYSPEGLPFYTRLVRKIVDKYAKRAGIDAHPHRFRHSFATHILDEGFGNLIALKDTLGHEDLEMVQLYVKTTKTGRELINSHHPRQKRK